MGENPSQFKSTRREVKHEAVTSFYNRLTVINYLLVSSLYRIKILNKGEYVNTALAKIIYICSAQGLTLVKLF